MFDVTGPGPDGTMPEGQPMRIGVFVCHCGGNISDVVDVKRVAEEASRMPDVAFATTHMFNCSDPGQALIEQKIREHGLTRVVVAACSPTLIRSRSGGPSSGPASTSICSST